MNPKNISVKSLRANGYKVFVRHFRYSNVDNNLYPINECRRMATSFLELHPDYGQKFSLIQPHGGKVEVELSNNEGKVFKGESVCHKKDVYNKKIGVRIALGRALATNI